MNIDQLQKMIEETGFVRMFLGFLTKENVKKWLARPMFFN